MSKGRNLHEEHNEPWRPYIDLIGEDSISFNGMIIKSPFYSGLNFCMSETPKEFLASQVQNIIRRAKRYAEITQQHKLCDDDISEIFMSLITKEYFDEYLSSLITTHQIEQTDEEWWDLVISCWTRQELNTGGIRKDRWRKIFTFRNPIPSLTSSLPDVFTAYRAGNEDGFSWTLDKKKAKWFQQRFRQQFGKIPFHERIFSKENALFYTDDRNEQEVVILPQ